MKFLPFIVFLEISSDKKRTRDGRQPRERRRRRRRRPHRQVSHHEQSDKRPGDVLRARPRRPRLPRQLPLDLRRLRDQDAAHVVELLSGRTRGKRHRLPRLRADSLAEPRQRAHDEPARILPVLRLSDQRLQLPQPLVRGGVHGRALRRRLLSPAQAVDVHDESRQDPDRRHLPRRPDDLRPGAGLHAHPAPGQRPARALPDRRGLGRRGERPQSARHPAHLRAALLRHRRAQLADREGGLARGQREDVAEGEDIGEGLAAGRASGQGHQDAADCVERILLPESAGLRDEALRLLSAEGGRDGGRAGLPDPEGLQPALQHELRHQLRPLLRERSEFPLGRRPAVQLSQEAPIARRPVKALVHQSDQRARHGYHKDKPIVLGRAHGRLREAALEGLLQDETLQPTDTERRKRNTRLLRRDGVKVKKKLYAPTMGDEGDLPRLLNGEGGRGSANERVQSTATAVHSYPM